MKGKNTNIVTTESNVGIDRKFNSEEWKAANLVDRSNFINDLLISDLLRGKSKIEVIELLGPPDGTWIEDNSIYYNIDMGQGLKKNKLLLNNLYIQFNKDDIAFSIKIST